MRFLWALVALGLFTSCARLVDPPQKEFAWIDAQIRSEAYSKASHRAQALLKRYPRSARLKMVLGKVEFLQGHFKEAILPLEAAVNAGWADLTLYRNLGMSYFYQGQWDKARGFLKKVAEFDSKDRDSAKALAYSHYYLGEGRSALEGFQRLATTDPTDLEASTALDAVMALTGTWRASQMIWITDPDSGVQLCYPGGWIRQKKQLLGPAGKVTVLTFSDFPPDSEGHLQGGWVLILSVAQNASLHPLPEIFKGPWRRGEPLEGNKVRYYATRPGAKAQYQTSSRDPDELAKRLTWDFRSFPEFEAINRRN